MAENLTPTSSSAETLTRADRDLLDSLRDGIAERTAIRNERSKGRAQKPEDMKQYRLEQNQERLGALFEEAVVQPRIKWALQDAGFNIEALHAKADRAVWRDVATAVNAIRSPAERKADDQRRDAIAEATRAIVETHRIGASETRGAWIDVLEDQVRASFAAQELRDAAVARRLVAWTEAALNVVPGPVAAGARLALAEHAYGGGAEGGEAMSRRRALRDILVRDESGQYPRPSADTPVSHEPEPRARDVNRILAGDVDPTLHGARQVRDFVDATRSAEPATAVGLITRLRGYFATRQAGAGAGAVAGEAVSGDDDGIPDSLKRRYAIHVSEDRRTIELFEGGAKAATITLNAKSISTLHNEGAVIADIVLLARDRGWQSLKVTGTAEFKDAVWLEARKAGLAAQHDPSSAVKAAHEKWERERPSNQVRPAPASQSAEALQDDLARAFAAKSAEERLADPRLRNAQLVLTIGIRTAEKELGRPIAEMPDVAKALFAAVREQLAMGKVFEAPFVRPSPPKPPPRPLVSPYVEADRVSFPRQ